MRTFFIVALSLGVAACQTTGSGTSAKLTKIVGLDGSSCPQVTSEFGSYTDRFGRNREDGKPHNGEDFDVSRNSPVRAAAAEKVTAVATKYTGGKYVVVLHGRDLIGSTSPSTSEYWIATGYFHLDGYAQGISKGDFVKRGQLIGFVGDTGSKSYGVHLHFDVKRSPSGELMETVPNYPPVVDPAPYWIRDTSGNISPMSKSFDYGEAAIADGKLPGLSVGFTNPLCNPVS